jgi:membrane-associated protein
MITQNILDFFLHLDKNLALIIQSYGTFAYVLLFIIIFCETGLVIMPFLPGDSLLFAAGALASNGMLNIVFLFIILIAAAIIGDSINYFIGNLIGVKVFKEKSKLFKKEYLTKAQTFYEKYGGKTIIIARFIPIIRTFAPFVAGIGKMKYKKFLIYNVIGGVLWVSLFLLAGYFFGSLPFVKNNFSLVIIIVIVISIIPAIIEYLRCKYNDYCLTKKFLRKL